MNCAIEFNDESMLRTIEIDNKRLDRMLRAKLQTVQLAFFYSVPQHLFSRGQVLKVSSRSNEFRGCSTNALRIHQANCRRLLQACPPLPNGYLFSVLLNPSMNRWVATFLERPLNPPQVRDFESPRVPQNGGWGANSAKNEHSDLKCDASISIGFA